ncbi:MAG: DegT/DnrJ/EryC1/StrS family aminotransferase [Cryomorphaceae bacterium]|nr:DegT/DnrJ/EryC1/StrS family aminotransferase [Flavobacteriales bacterium]
MSSQAEYKKGIAHILNATPEQVFLYWKGRVGLYALLRAMGIGKGDEVILPAFTCVVVPNAILYAGATPVYVDVNPDTFLPRPDQIKAAVTERTKCILVQNTFGLSHQVDEICTYARDKKIYTIEDCTHGFGGTYKGQPNGSFSDAAFYSTQWNKPFSTGVGGFAYLRNTDLQEDLMKVNEALIPVPAAKNFSLRLLILLNKYLLNDFTYWTLLKLYRFLSKTGLVIGSSGGGEIASTEMPEDYFMASSKVQHSQGVRGLKKLPEDLKLRKRNALKLNDWMRENGKYHIDHSLVSNHSFLKYPVICKDKDLFTAKANESNIRLGDWFNSLLHPVQGTLSPWGIDDENQFPIAAATSKKILNLPADTENIEKLLEFLEDNKALIE